MVKQALILAAGNGSRIKRFRGDVPKPLRKVAGLTLIKRAILTAKRAGVQEVVIVVGYKGDQIIKSLSHDTSLGVKLQFVTNQDWQKSNGVSVLSAKPLIKSNFLLLMADHIFDYKAINKILEVPLNGSQVLLGIDKKLNDIFDLEDVTKVALRGDKICDIGKQLSSYDAFDTGAFVCTDALFDTLEQIYQEKGDVSLSDGIRSLAERRQARVCDLSNYYWQDVDTPEALRQAEKMLFKSVQKNTDGFISKHINRRISIAITKILVKTNLSANHVTGLVTLVGILSGVMVATGRYTDIAIGGILFKLSSILDGCDGELSKLKLTSSKTGAWLDTLSDNLTYLVFLVGVTLGIYQQGTDPHLALEATLLFGGLILSLAISFYYLLRYTNSGSLVTIQQDLAEEVKIQGRRGFFNWASKIKFMMKRDFFALCFMSLALANQLPWILHLSVIGVNLTWVMFLTYKREIFKIDTANVVESHH
jgi:1L-myo-inositol 1-phosphate cytidylyltransferase / CDP-L-myo-inositol myo-inositolphosphotransferase